MLAMQGGAAHPLPARCVFKPGEQWADRAYARRKPGRARARQGPLQAGVAQRGFIIWVMAALRPRLRAPFFALIVEEIY